MPAKRDPAPTSVTLQFVQGRNLGASLIQWFGGGPRYSHVDVVMPDGTLLGARNDSVGAMPPGVRIRPASYVMDDHTLRVSVPADPSQIDAFYAFLRAQVGKPYDKIGIFGFLIGRAWRDTESWFCSELVSAALEQASIIRPLAAPSNRITPPDLVLVLSAIVPVTLPPW